MFNSLLLKGFLLGLAIVAVFGWLVFIYFQADARSFAGQNELGEFKTLNEEEIYQK